MLKVRPVCRIEQRVEHHGCTCRWVEPGINVFLGNRHDATVMACIRHFRGWLIGAGSKREESGLIPTAFRVGPQARNKQVLARLRGEQTLYALLATYCPTVHVLY